MKPFLYQVAEATYLQYGQQINEQTFVFPNRRAGVFFQKYLSEIVGKPLFSPRITTINELFRSFTGFSVMDRTNLLFTLYKHYHRIAANDESFDDFVFWGEMILNDFDDVDKYVVDARQLFSNIKDLKEIESDFAGLTEEQIASVREFWYNFQPHKQGKTKDEFLATWKILYSLYNSFRNELIDKGEVYEGMIFREVTERILRKEQIQLPTSKYVFVGLNALSRSEEILLYYLKNQKAAQFYWDIESPKVTDPDNKASLFVNRYSKTYPSELELNSDQPNEIPHIEIIGVSSATGQARQLYPIIKRLLASNAITNSERAINTAVVLPDELLLMPSLYSIPEEIQTVNVTMGYPLSSSPIVGLMEHLFQMQIHRRTVRGEQAFYYRFLLPVLNHRYIVNIAPDFIQKTYEQTLVQNRVYLSESEFKEHTDLAVIFSSLKENDNVCDYLLKVIEIIQKQLDKESLPTDEDKNNLVQLEREYIYQYYLTINRIGDLIRQSDLEISMETLFRLIRKMIIGISIPFQGEPLSGLQIMGVLETRALDFENLIILSMNEGIFPLKNASNSFIPYNLRKGFGLSTYEHQDSVYAYHFYRMIHRAKNIYLLHDTRSEGIQTGEVSRYVHQLKYHYRMKMEEKLLTFNVTSQINRPISVQKSEKVLHALSQFHEGGERALSASSINTYLDCPLKFYFREIEKMGDEESVSEEVEANQFGTIFHSVMERLYKPYEGQIVSVELIDLLKKSNNKIWEEVVDVFNKVVFFSDKKQILSGHNLLIAKVIQRYVQQTFEVDKSYAPFVYKASEEKIRSVITTPSGLNIQLKGSIDRVDEIRNQLRIIDYKTGNGDLEFADVAQLFNVEDKKRPKAVMQVFLYSWLYAREKGVSNILPGIYYLRTMFGNFTASLRDKTNKTSVDSFDTYNAEFEEALKGVIDEICSPDKEFAQTSVAEHCKYCEFKEICRKE
ncbi:MAG: PD-(D/E)XK nuclease family protein [Bacteroidales bacterium]